MAQKRSRTCEPARLLVTEDEYRLQIVRAIAWGLLVVAVSGGGIGFSVFITQFSSPRVTVRDPSSISHEVVFSFLLASIVSLKVATRIALSSDDDYIGLARRSALSKIAWSFVPVSLGAGIYAAGSVLSRAPNEIPLLELFTPLVAGLILAVFAADASLAINDHVNPKTLGEVQRERFVSRKRDEYRRLVKRPSRASFTGGHARGRSSWCVGRGKLALHVRRVLGKSALRVEAAIGAGVLLVPSVLILLTFPIQYARGPLAVLSVLSTAVVVFTVYSGVVSTIRADWTIFGFVLIMGSLIILALIVMSISMVSHAHGAGYGVKFEHLGVLPIALLVVILLTGAVTIASLRMSSFGPGALRSFAISRSWRQYRRASADRPHAGRTGGPLERQAKVSVWLAVVPPVGGLLAMATLMDSGASGTARKWSFVALGIATAVFLVAVGTLGLITIMRPDLGMELLS
ncbi:hypothetical protein Q7C18_01395 [Nesterenkonia sp. CL21]|uniref:hypothetical protein n=1 Tax=Nesterenkonia sp. CL21 TaxID=3064894 RepID=UPI0028797A1B|nr:hypothetical protein [Nesterenkonia sp. CL21]MDS2171351.1 hypothetical protein [Nesterenkonia sp. CL21]